MEKDINASMIGKNFIPKGIKIEENTIFPMAVIATVSSGKSTLINAILGKDILPNSNVACTALNYFILDDDNDSKEIICATDKRGKVQIIEDNLAEELCKLNASANVRDIFIRSHIKGVLNTDRALLIIDTPGPNNSMDTSHEKILFKTIDKMNGGMFLYVLNASQLCIRDEKNLLVELKKITEKKRDIKILFVINKIDVLDESYESIQEIIKVTKEYINECGFFNVDIVPVSAKAAILFKKVLAGQRLTRKEYSDFVMLYELFKPTDYNMRKYAITGDLSNQFENIELKGEEYTVGNLNQAIVNTGICLVEECIQKAQILSSGQIKNTLKVRMK